MTALDEQKTVTCSCEQCRSLCSGKPGWFRPGEATKAAAELGMPLVDFFKKHLTRDFHVDGDKRTFLLSPAWRGNNGRTAGYGDVRRRGPCSLLTPTGCALSFEARPAECRNAYGCRAFDSTAHSRWQDAVALYWEACPEELQALEAAEAFDPSDDGGEAIPLSGLFGGWL